MEVLDENQVKNIKIGVAGIGSSNDFCKPFNPKSFINKVPCKINFNSTQLRDVGCIHYKADGKIKTKYFLLNASIGVTAEANYLFNHPNFILGFLKKYFSRAAILYAAAKTIFTHKNFDIKIAFSFNEAYLFSISNLSVIKSPNFSGNLAYPNKGNYQNGLFDIYLAHSMNYFDLIKLLSSLSKKVFPKSEKTKQGTASRIRISSEKEFFIEFDGEVIKTNYAEFSILNKYLNICSN
jgi:diacylglycerol kinase family enzyme